MGRVVGFFCLLYVALVLSAVLVAFPSKAVSLTGLSRPAWAGQEVLRNTLATYDYEPRDPSSNRVEVDRIISALKNASINTYNFLLYHAPKTDYEDFVSFLEAAHSAGVYVWADITPPSEPPYADPHGMDYVAWAKDFANLSLKYPNFVAFTIDDFDLNLKTFSPSYVREMREAYRAINPTLAFIPTVYGGFRDFMEAYGDHVDGILLPYTDLDYTLGLSKVLSSAREALGNKVLVAFIYAAPTSWHQDFPTLEYLWKALTTSYLYADGVMTYVLPLTPEQSHYEEYLLVQRLFRVFSQWQGDRSRLAESFEAIFAMYDTQIENFKILADRLQFLFCAAATYSVLITIILIRKRLKRAAEMATPPLVKKIMSPEKEGRKGEKEPFKVYTEGDYTAPIRVHEREAPFFLFHIQDRFKELTGIYQRFENIATEDLVMEDETRIIKINFTHTFKEPAPSTPP